MLCLLVGNSLHAVCSPYGPAVTFLQTCFWLDLLVVLEIVLVALLQKGVCRWQEGITFCWKFVERKHSFVTPCACMCQTSQQNAA